MALQEHQKENFHTLSRAFEEGEVCLMECTDNKTGELVAVVCACQVDEDGQYVFTPFAQLVHDGFERFTPP